MRALTFIGFVFLLGLVGYIRGRDVSWGEQCAWVGGAFLAALLVYTMGWW